MNVDDGVRPGLAPTLTVEGDLEVDPVSPQSLSVFMSDPTFLLLIRS